MRKLRLLATLVPLVALAFPAAAQLEKFKDWDKSPEFTYYATEDEHAAWKAVKSDEEAQKISAEELPKDGDAADTKPA